MSSFTLLPAGESSDLAEDIRQLFADIAAHLAHDRRALSGECHPALDVLETAAAVTVIVDVSGVEPDAIRVLFRAGVLIVAGEKAPDTAGGPCTFHQVEREFGRFARAVRVSDAVDAGRARAALAHGELVITLPRLADRRGAAHRIPVTSGSDTGQP
jgi:HSP20 family protein